MKLDEHMEPNYKAEQMASIDTTNMCRHLHIYRDGKKILVLAGKSAPKIVREDTLTELL